MGAVMGAIMNSAAHIDAHITRWLDTKPGLVEADTANDVLRKAWAMCGVACSVEDFRIALFNRGYAVICNRHGCRIALPENSPNLSADCPRNRASILHPWGRR